jgi:predicted permease
LAPTLRSTRLNLASEFQAGTRSLGSAALSRLGQLLVVVQVAVSVVLLICSVLFVRVLWQAGRIDLGFQPEQRLLFAVDAQGAGYKPDQADGLYRRLTENIDALPGVRSVSFSGWPVLTGEGGPFFGSLELPGKNQKFRGVMWNPIGEDFFKAYGMPLLQGRGFTHRDDAKAAEVAIVNQAFAQRYFGPDGAVGQRILFQGDREIVGVVPDARLAVSELHKDVEPLVFIPFAQSHQLLARFVVHTKADPMAMLPAIKQRVSKTDANVAMVGVCTQAEQVAWRFLNQRMVAWLAGLIGLVALGLVSVGIYGLMSYAVQRRTSEIGVRIALGALPRWVLWMVIRESLTIIFVGLVAGIALACGVTQMLAHMLWGLSPTDPLTYGAVALSLTLVALFACWLPARRAAKVDPMEALRCE